MFIGGTKCSQEGREDVNDEERAGRPSTSTTDEKINEVEKMILANRLITVREVAEDLNISIGSCHSIFINDLGMRRVAAKFVPKLLNCDQKQHRMNIANEMSDSVRDDPNLLQRVITGDEADGLWCNLAEPCPKPLRQETTMVRNARNQVEGWRSQSQPHTPNKTHRFFSTLTHSRGLFSKLVATMSPQPKLRPSLSDESLDRSFELPFRRTLPLSTPPINRKSTDSSRRKMQKTSSFDIIPAFLSFFLAGDSEDKSRKHRENGSHGSDTVPRSTPVPAPRLSLSRRQVVYANHDSNTSRSYSLGESSQAHYSTPPFIRSVSSPSVRPAPRPRFLPTALRDSFVPPVPRPRTKLPIPSIASTSPTLTEVSEPESPQVASDEVYSEIDPNFVVMGEAKCLLDCEEGPPDIPTPTGCGELYATLTGSPPSVPLEFLSSVLDASPPQLIDTLGTGNFGEVVEGVLTTGNVDVSFAVKKFNIKSLPVQKETKLNKNLRFNIKDYTTLRMDRPGKFGGGLAVLIKTLEIKFKEIAYNQSLIETLSEASSNIAITLGDFNAERPTWGSPVQDNKGQQVEDMLTDLDLTPLNNEKNTYLSKSTGTESAIEITAINYNIAPITQWKILKSAISDYRPILTTLKFKIENFQQNKRTLEKNYRKA
ncbi:hypothetical protein LAZ67_X000821 [Cordylochernes scorpioides]|uniref:Endonuclease/exonuclease/phosphatase domain-containing protein n=1 Tax=Cordylochernes scorpioides TaxID=51811 RepID=A0ABY6LSC9_9ARAC|nr:hypothetical protein LAZ67_X000821 [Cordylochernes scorpioides]